MRYKILGHCFNCKFSGELEIERGVLIKEAECSYCGCKTLISGDEQISDIQTNILKLAEQKILNNKTLRTIGKLIGCKHPQAVVHHLQMLEKKGKIIWNRKRKQINLTELEASNSKL